MNSLNGADDAPCLGSGKPPSVRGTKAEQGFGVFDWPDCDGMLRDGQQMIETVSSALRWIRVELDDACCGACVLGEVSDALPRIHEVLTTLGVTPEMVTGVWAVPPYVVKGLPRRTTWHPLRPRLEPFLKANLWPRLHAEVKCGVASDLGSMGLLAENVVVVKFSHGPSALLRAAIGAVSLRGAVRVVRAAWRMATFEHALSLASAAWPFRWTYLLLWMLCAAGLVLSQIATAHITPITWHDRMLVVLANVTAAVYAARARSPIARALHEARTFKAAGSIALGKGKVHIAADQYRCGQQEAAKLLGNRHLNATTRTEGVNLQVACLNNSALVALKQQEWVEAARLCTAALLLQPPDVIAEAKALYRRAIAQAKRQRTAAAIRDLQRALQLQPADSEIAGLLRLLEMSDARRKSARSELDEDCFHESAGLSPKAYGAVPDRSSDMAAGSGLRC